MRKNWLSTILLAVLVSCGVPGGNIFDGDDDCPVPRITWQSSREAYDSQTVIDLATKLEAAAKADAARIHGLEEGEGRGSLGVHFSRILESESARGARVSEEFFEKALDYRQRVCTLIAALERGLFTTSEARAKAESALTEFTVSFRRISQKAQDDFEQCRQATIHFDDVSLLPGDRVDAKDYLSKHNIHIREVTPREHSSGPIIYSPPGASSARASSPPCYLTQDVKTEPDQETCCPPCSFTIELPKPALRVIFTRIEVEAPSSHPWWSAHALDEDRGEISSVEEDLQINGAARKTFTLEGPGIKHVRFRSWNKRFATFGAVLIDDLILEFREE